MVRTGSLGRPGPDKVKCVHYTGEWIAFFRNLNNENNKGNV